MNINPARQQGLALISLVIIMLVLGVIAYAFVGIISSHHFSTVEIYNSTRAFYISEGALQLGKKVISDEVASGNISSWGSHTVLFTDEPLGEGTFSLSVFWDQGSDFFTFTASARIN